MKNAILEAMETMRDFMVPECLVDSVNWESLKNEIQIENAMHDLIQTWLEICQ